MITVWEGMDGFLLELIPVLTGPPQEDSLEGDYSWRKTCINDIAVNKHEGCTGATKKI